MHVKGEEVRQRGYTLVEMLVAMAIAAIAITAAVMSIYSVQTSVNISNDRNLALASLSAAASVIRNDLAMAQSTNLGVSPQSSANLSWVDYTTSFESANQTAYSVQYIFAGDTLLRTFAEEGETAEESIAGRNLSSVTFTQVEAESGKLVTVTLVSTNATARLEPEIMIFNVHLRAEAQ